MRCKHCGKDSEEPISNSQQGKPKTSFWLKSLLCLIALIITILLIDSFVTEDLTDTVKNQLEAIKKGQIAEAYYEFSSKKFQEATSLEAYQEFIKKHPAFAENKSIQFKERNVDNDIGTLDCIINTNHHQKIAAEYKLIKESDQWKVLSIRLEAGIAPLKHHKKQLTASEQANHPSPIKFHQFVLGNALSPLGLVKQPAHTFKADSGDIYLNLYVANATLGEQIRVTFTHLDSQSVLNPVVTRTLNNDEAILSFVFSPPKSNWPKGHYRIEAKSTYNNKGLVDFIIE